MRIILTTVAALGVSLAASAQGSPEFRADVLPILEEHCFQCHRAPFVDERGRTRKPKGGLRLDGAGWMLQGGDEGPAVVAGQPRRSPLYVRVILPADDDDRMPQKADPLSGAHLEVLRAWVEGGADFGGWQGEPGGEVPETEDVAVAPYLALVDRLGQGVSPVTAAARAKAAGKVAQISVAQPGSPLLRVEFASNEPLVGDKEIQALGPVRSLVTQLDLGRTKISDRALSTIGDMSRLTRLDLRKTAVTDRGLRSLSGLAELRYLNLYGTAITDKGLASLEGLDSLEAVYLWGTKVTERGVARLRAKFPGAQVHSQMKLPAVEQSGNTDDDEPRRRRRR